MNTSEPRRGTAFEFESQYDNLSWKLWYTNTSLVARECETPLSVQSQNEYVGLGIGVTGFPNS